MGVVMRRYYFSFAAAAGGFFLLASAMSVFSDAATVEYDLGAGNPLFNRAVRPLAAPVVSSEKKEQSAVFQQLSQRSPVAIVDDLRTIVIEEKDPLVQFCAMEMTEYTLRDADLMRDVTLALSKNSDLLAKIVQVRQSIMQQWEQWFDAEKKEEMYAALLTAYEKELKKQKIVSADSAAEFARRTVLADYRNADFVGQMLQSIRGSAYYSLLFFVLGYPITGEQIAREVNGVALNDQSTRQRMLADMIVAYRREYDAIFATACISSGLTFVRESEAKAKFFKTCMRNEYSNTSAVASDLSPRFDAILSAARAYAHKEAASFMNAKCAKITQLLTLFAARLEVVRVSDSLFTYPTADQASREKLSEGSLQSILLGLAYRVSQQLLMRHEYIITSQQIQSFFVQEYQGQHRLQHISTDVLKGERFLKSSQEFEKAQRKSFEARCAVLFGDIDFLLQGAFDADVQSALVEYDIAQGAELYKKLMIAACQKNAARWRIVTSERQNRMLQMSTGMIKKLQQDVWAYLQTLGIIMTDEKGLPEQYKECIESLQWQEGQRASFTTQAPLFFSSLSRSKKGRVTGSPERYQALYKFFWLCVGGRLLADVAIAGQSSAQGESEVNQDVLASQVQELSQRVSEQTFTTPEDESLAGALTQAQKKLSSFGATMSSRVEQLKGNALRYASGQSGMKGVNTDILYSLKDSTQMLTGMQESVRSIFEKSTQASDRLIGSIKASLILVDRCVDLCSKQMTSLEKGFQKFYDKVNKYPSIGTMIRRFVGGSIKSMLTDVNRDNEVPLARIKQALADMQLVLQGKKRSTELQI
jgi:hypothetical protein